MSSALHARLLASIDAMVWPDEDWLPPAFKGGPAALRAVVELHEPTHFLRRPLARPICETCSTDDDMHDERWPCSTIRVIAEKLGVEIEDKSIAEKESPTDG